MATTAVSKILRINQISFARFISSTVSNKSKIEKFDQTNHGVVAQDSLGQVHFLY